MQNDKDRFLNYRMLPARFTAQEAAWFLGVNEHDIPILVRASILKPLGHPPQTGVKYFARFELEELSRQPKALARLSDALYVHWQRKNERSVDLSRN
jgi:hypothetical protein